MPGNTERREKKRSSGRGLLVFLLCACAAVFAALFYIRHYSPDPDANVNPAFGAGNGMPEAYGSDAFSGMKQVEGRYNFLIVGLDKTSRSTDIMMIVSYRVTDGTINIVQIPRDTYIKTADVKTACKINSYYSIFYRAAKNADAKDPDMTALKNLAAMIEKNFRVRINYSAVVDLDGFVGIIDAVGGVYLDIPEDMFYEDPYQDLYIDLKAGYQHLDGEHAMQFVRYRKGYVQQDIGRQNALKNFMSAFMAQIKENLSVTAVVGIAGEIMSNMKSNIGAADFVYFGKSALSVDLSRVSMMTLPGEAATVGGASVYVLYKADTVAVINEYLNVFDVPAADGFDPDSYMVKTDDEDSVRIYGSPAGTWKNNVYNASDVNGDPIDIPRG